MPDDQNKLAAVHFVTSTLAPLFLHDPLLEIDAILPLLKAFGDLDADELASTWPFVNKDTIRPYAHQLVDGSSLVLRGETDVQNDAITKTAVEPTEKAEADSAIEALACDYRRLFVGPGEKEAPPWGSVYLDKDCVTFGTSTLQLKDWLADQGISVSFGSSDEPEDSLGALLALTAWVATEKPQLVPELLQLHILPWASHFLELMEHRAKHPFYQGLAGITRLSLEGISDAFQLDVETPPFYR